MSRSGAAGVIIGNEVLSAKVDEANGALLIKRLRDRGIPLRSLSFVPDDVDAIVEAIGVARARARYVVTSGGIGPTHDDVTVRAVALALGRRVVRLPEIEQLVRQHYGEHATPEAMRLADAPEGVELLRQDGIWYPVLSCDEIFMLPGVPQLFRVQLENVLARLPEGKVHLRCIYLSLGEPEIARVLDRVALAAPHVAIGSYPQWDKAAGYKTKLTAECSDAAQVDDVVAKLLEALPREAIIKVE